MLHTYQADDCCGDALGEHIRTENMEGVLLWTCPKCGMEWRRHEAPRIDHGEEVVVWRPECPVMIFKT